jgi:catechol 2,3-dioxygenase-like lactoylglutathione lyase family enzyme
VDRPRFRSISAVTLATRDMARAVRFYRALGFDLASGGETAGFTSFVPTGGETEFRLRVVRAQQFSRPSR